MNQSLKRNLFQLLNHCLGMPNQFPATQANPAAMYMPTIPSAVASSPQHQPHMYHQNVNQQSIPPMQVIDHNLSNG